MSTWSKSELDALISVNKSRSKQSESNAMSELSAASREAPEEADEESEKRQCTSLLKPECLRLNLTQVTGCVSKALK